MCYGSRVSGAIQGNSVVAIEKGAFGSPSTTVGQLYWDNGERRDIQKILAKEGLLKRYWRKRDNQTILAKEGLLKRYWRKRDIQTILAKEGLLKRYWRKKRYPKDIGERWVTQKILAKEEIFKRYWRKNVFSKDTRFGLFLWHINHCWLFDANPFLYI